MTKIAKCTGRLNMKCSLHVKKSIEKRVQHEMPCPTKPPAKKKVKTKEEADKCTEFDNEAKVEIYKEQIKLIARQEHECVAELGQAHNIAWRQCTQMSQNKTKVHE